MIIPIGTDIRTRRPPVANWLLIALNVVIFLLTDVLSGPAGAKMKNVFSLDAARPELWQYLTYQFLHGDLLHLSGNMLFLWIFGDAVCDRMGSVAYLMFYAAGGVFAGVVFAGSADNPMIGASGAIAAVTTAFLALYPRVHVTLFIWFILVTTLHVPAMVVIVFKIILWDNVIAPALDRNATSNVAYSAHLGGYAFGFLIAFLMLIVRALPRNQFDALALWSRWRRRAGIGGDARLSGGRAARSVDARELQSRPLPPESLSPVANLRELIVERVADRDMVEAARLYNELMSLDPRQVLPRRTQLELAHYLAQAQQHVAAATAYEALLANYPGVPDAPQVRLLLGLIYNRYLGDPGRAAPHLMEAAEQLGSEEQRALALEELRRMGIEPAAQ